MPADSRRITIELSENGKKAFITFARVPEGVTPTPDWISDTLRAKKIVKGIDWDAVKEFIEHITRQGEFRGRSLVASAVDPRNGEDASIKWLVKKGDVVRPGSMLAEKTPATRGVSGFTLVGRELPTRQGEDVPLPAGKNTSQGSRGLKLYSVSYGIVEPAGGVINVHVPITVSPDKMKAVIDLVPKDFEQKDVTPEDVVKTLGILGFKGTLIEDEIKTALSSGEAQKGVLVMRGSYSGKGEKGSFSFLGESGSFVLPGEKVVELVEGGHGTEGVDVYGNPIKGEVGEAANMPVLDKTLRIDDRRHIIVSTAYGRLVYTEHKASVQDTLVVSGDQFEARIDAAPHGISGAVMRPEIILEQLSEHGITAGIDSEAINQAIRVARQVRLVQEGVVVARGTPVRDGIDMAVDFKFKLDGRDPLEIEDPDAVRRRDFMLKGRVIADVRPHREHRDGLTVYGKKIPARQGRVIDLQTGGNVSEGSKGRQLVADAHGFCDYRNGRISIIPLMQAAEDGMSVAMTLFPANTSKRALSAEIIQRLLTLEKIIYGIDLDAINKAVKEVADSGERVNFTAAAGREPVDGKDASLEYHVDFTKKVGEERMDGSIDFRERSFIPVVNEGDLIITMHPPSKGRRGVTVFGKELPAQNGEKIPFVPGEGVKIVKENHYHAAIKGAACLTEHNLKVVNMFVVPGSVNYDTGNIRFDGTVRIEGSVTDTFTVSATSDVEVMGSVEDAVIEAGGNIVIHGGIFQKGSGYIKAEGTVQAVFGTNANIQAVEGISIIKDAVNCTLQTAGEINITQGKGRAVGGHLVAARGINVRELGSEGAVTTVAELALPDRIERRFSEIAREIDEIETSLEKISSQLYYALQAGFDNLPDERKAHVRKLETVKEELTKRKDQFIVQRDSLSKEKAALEHSKIEVIGTIWPGVQIKIKGLSFAPNKPLHYTGFKYSTARDAIERT